MAIDTELTKLNDFILEAYQVIEDKGGEVPENKNMENLPAAIDTLGDIPKSLCFTSSGNSTIQLEITGTLTNSVDIYYSYDNSTWTSWLSGTSGSSSTLTLTDGQKLYVWNKNSTLSESVSKYVKFVMTGSLAASGNVNSMINYSSLSSYCYYYMFRGCTSLTTPPKLPATTLAEYCYYYMFRGCTSLTTPPELPATTLANHCYYAMLSDCTSLTTPPKLPATTLAEYCYNLMFNGCTSLTTAPALPATTLVNSCYSNMFNGCTSLKVNENGTEGTSIFTCPDLTGLTYPVTNMFTSTGGTFTGTPTAENTYKYY